MNQAEPITTKIFLPVFAYAFKQNGLEHTYTNICAAGTQISRADTKSLTLTLQNDERFKHFYLTVIPPELIKDIPRTNGDYSAHEVYVSLEGKLNGRKKIKPYPPLKGVCDYCFNNGILLQPSSDNGCQEDPDYKLVYDRGLSLTRGLFSELIKTPDVDQYIQTGIEKILKTSLKK